MKVSNSHIVQYISSLYVWQCFRLVLFLCLSIEFSPWYIVIMSDYKGNVNIHVAWHKPTTPIQITVQYMLSSILCPLDFSPFLHSHLVYIYL